MANVDDDDVQMDDTQMEDSQMGNSTGTSSSKNPSTSQSINGRSLPTIISNFDTSHALTALFNGAATEAFNGDITGTDDGTDEDDVSSRIKAVPSPRVRPFEGVVIEYPPVTLNLPYSSKRTGLVYDPRMRYHAELELDEDEEIHPEDPRRIFEIYKDLVEAGLVDVEGSDLDARLRPYKLVRIPVREAEPGEICLVHSEEHYNWMVGLRNWSKRDLIDRQREMDSLYLHNLTFYCAKLSAGGAIEACRAVAAGRVKNAMAVIRPPGHHAEHNKPGGFCFFDNVAIAAKVCQKDFGEDCRKILILDWDVHHGNGVQMAFEDNPNVLYISLHVHSDGNFYPSGTYGDHLHVGYGAGEGKNINIPWRTNGMTDGDYMYAFQHIVMPCAYEFNPDLVIISAGFDAAEGDMLGGCHVSPAGFAHMTHMLMSLAGGKVVACLEGGYNLRAIARSALAVTRTLMGEPPDRLPEGMEAQASAVDIVNLVIRTQSPYWKCLHPKNLIKSRLQDMRGERLHDILRRLQAQEYATKFHMADLWICNEKLSQSFEKQVLATPNYTEARPLIVIFHDPPESVGEKNSHTGVLDAHNIIITDIAKQYLEWAVDNGFAVIDVNLPKFITHDEKQDGYEDRDPMDERINAMKECAMYLWQNHIEPYDSTEIFLMGMGDSTSAVTHLLSNADGIQERISWVFNFTCEHDLRAVARAGDDYFADWFHKHSDVFVARNHQAWNPERTRRIRRKFGNLHRSGFNELNEVLLESKQAVQDRLLVATQNWKDAEEKRKAANTRLPSIRTSTGHQFGDELRPAGPPTTNLFPQMSYTSSFQPDIPVRGSPSPSRQGLKSPTNRLPPMGIFYTSPERGAGTRSPITGSPSRR